ncbi:MAG: hypothetical protein EZS28_020486 [Streblomastix strix]|uniref:Uncharacterized protein n=1 Tax=Streblomastix strix TaxID=222440 RepID=A0A5J4VN01_9EUKA|nr:MAG: hypothetical protein EZS28_020486 [Streblomastix strix]
MLPKERRIIHNAEIEAAHAKELAQIEKTALRRKIMFRRKGMECSVIVGQMDPTCPELDMSPAQQRFVDEVKFRDERRRKRRMEHIALHGQSSVPLSGQYQYPLSTLRKSLDYRPQSQPGKITHELTTTNQQQSQQSDQQIQPNQDEGHQLLQRQLYLQYLDSNPQPYQRWRGKGDPPKDKLSLQTMVAWRPSSLRLFAPEFRDFNVVTNKFYPPNVYMSDEYDVDDTVLMDGILTNKDKEKMKDIIERDLVRERQIRDEEDLINQSQRHPVSQNMNEDGSRKLIVKKRNVQTAFETTRSRSRLKDEQKQQEKQQQDKQKDFEQGQEIQQNKQGELGIRDNLIGKDMETELQKEIWRDRQLQREEDKQKYIQEVIKQKTINGRQGGWNKDGLFIDPSLTLIKRYAQKVDGSTKASFDSTAYIPYLPAGSLIQPNTNTKLPTSMMNPAPPPQPIEPSSKTLTIFPERKEIEFPNDKTIHATKRHYFYQFRGMVPEDVKLNEADKDRQSQLREQIANNDIYQGGGIQTEVVSDLRPNPQDLIYKHNLQLKDLPYMLYEVDKQKADQIGYKPQRTQSKTLHPWAKGKMRSTLHKLPDQ